MGSNAVDLKQKNPLCCGIGSWGGQCLSLAPYVTGTGATRGVGGAGGA
jgi:hypothetical protein